MSNLNHYVRQLRPRTESYTPHVDKIQDLLVESPKSDRYEKDIAAALDKIKDVTAERPKVSSAYADIYVTAQNGNACWIEVKMNHTDNLGNPRVYYDGKKWDTTYTMPSAHKSVELLNKSDETKLFVEAISKFSGIKNPKIPTSKLGRGTNFRGLKDKDAVPLEVMREYFSQPGINRYIMTEPDVNLGKEVTDHYLKGKAEPAYYMQAGDDFYMIGSANPLKLKGKIPLLAGSGPFRMRIATRSDYYEVQAELKIQEMKESRYSIKPGSKKINPFVL
jgi:hypothetical protein